jgi:archaemetzincin
LLLDELDSRIIDRVVLRALEAGISASVTGTVRCETGFDSARGQWRADVALSNCVKQGIQAGRMSLVLTERDLYVVSLNFVFGLARSDLQAAIVSWHRLRHDNVDIFADRIAKEIVHEIGHLEGLEHCRDPSCVMWFSNSLQETDRKGMNFCHRCSQRRS